MERRNQASGIAVEERGADGAEISGYSAVFGQETDILGLFVEQIDQNAFNSVLAEKQDTRALFDHDTRYILGRVGNGTLNLHADFQGLQARIRPNMAVSYAKDVVESIKRGDLFGQSFAFTVLREQWEFPETGTARRTILSIDNLYDVGPVTYPAYPQTSVQVDGLRSLYADAFEARCSIGGLEIAPTAGFALMECRGKEFLQGSTEAVRTYIDGIKRDARRVRFNIARSRLSLREISLPS